MNTQLDISSFPGFETTPYDRLTDLEKIARGNNIIPDLRSVRISDMPLSTDWVNVRKNLVKFLSENIDSSEQIAHGRRYIAYKVHEAVVKFLYKKKDTNLIVNRQLVRQTKSRDTIFRAHLQEHAITRRYFEDMVPDTLFIVSPFPVESLPYSDKRTALKPERSHFMIQECIDNAVSIHEASQGERAELPDFKDSLEEFLGNYLDMRTNEHFIPELPSLYGKNVVVSEDGNVWVIDTNNLVKTHTHNGDWVGRYKSRWKVDKLTHSDSIIRAIEELIDGVERGHVPGNPQG